MVLHSQTCLIFQAGSMLQKLMCACELYLIIPGTLEDP